MPQGKLYHLSDLFDFFVKATDVFVGYGWYPGVLKNVDSLGFKLDFSVFCDPDYAFRGSGDDCKFSLAWDWGKKDVFKG